jgi:predicted nucleic acid-binding Zn ribbon protein
MFYLLAGNHPPAVYFSSMPIYVYEIINEDGTPGDRFEIHQSMKDDALRQHPETGQPVRRVLLPPNLASKYTPGQTKNKLDNRNVEKAGFTKYEKDKLTGKYHRVAGSGGPTEFSKPDSL